MSKKHNGGDYFFLTMIAPSFMENAGVRGMGLLAAGHSPPIIEGLWRCDRIAAHLWSRAWVDIKLYKAFWALM